MNYRILKRAAVAVSHIVLALATKNVFLALLASLVRQPVSGRFQYNRNAGRY